MKPRYIQYEEANKELLKAFHQTNNELEKQRIMTEIILKNERFIFFIINKLYRMGEKEDFYQTGVIGLIKAVQTYKFEKKVKFITYANRCIINEILMLFRKKKQDLLYFCDSLNYNIIEQEHQKTNTIKDIKDSSNNIDDSITYADFNIAIKKLKPLEQQLVFIYSTK
jgi:RNA polymerase sporulation-specific sigma factor